VHKNGFSNLERQLSNKLFEKPLNINTTEYTKAKEINHKKQTKSKNEDQNNLKTKFTTHIQ